jgi:hypothetical protein
MIDKDAYHTELNSLEATLPHFNSLIGLKKLIVRFQEDFKKEERQSLNVETLNYWERYLEAHIIFQMI